MTEVFKRKRVRGFPTTEGAGWLVDVLRGFVREWSEGGCPGVDGKRRRDHQCTALAAACSNSGGWFVRLEVIPAFRKGRRTFFCFLARQQARGWEAVAHALASYLGNTEKEQCNLWPMGGAGEQSQRRESFAEVLRRQEVLPSRSRFQRKISIMITFTEEAKWTRIVKKMDVAKSWAYSCVDGEESEMSCSDGLSSFGVKLGSGGGRS